ncbi:MAG: baeS [Rhodoferax sp.]|nr:baeS [Rhodoferax sp.]
MPTTGARPDERSGTHPGANMRRMFRLTLQRKFFLALTLLLVALLAVFVGLTRLGLQRNLGDYVAEIELSRLDWLALRLEQAYAEKGSWTFLQADPDAWFGLQMPRQRDGDKMRFDRGPPLPGLAPPDGRDRGPGDPGRGEPGRPGEPGGSWGSEGPGGPGPRPLPQVDLLPDRHAPPPPPDAPGDPRGRPDSVYQRLAVLDAAATVLAGARVDLGRAIRQPLTYQGRAVGYLALAPLQSTQTEAGRAFIAQQLGFVVTTGLAGLLLALLISWQFAKRWLAPIRQLMLGAEAVAAGRLDTQVALRGSDELALLTRTFNAMAARLAGVDASRQRWLADVAHELRTPLAAMRAEIEALQDGVRPYGEATAARLHRQVMRLGQLVDDLRLSLQEPGGPPLQLAPVPVIALLLEAAGAMAPRFSAAGIALEPEGLQALTAETGSRGPLVLADARRLGQVFGNLLENSLRYTDAGGRVVLTAAVVQDTAARVIRIDIQDTAPGPAAEDLPRLFDRFYRGEASRSRVAGDLGGSGLGLAICKALVEAHGGRISVQASQLGGLWTTLVLPLEPT